METRLVQCANCGAELDLATGKCPYCEPGEEASLEILTSPPPDPAALERERVLGLQLFEAEEQLARGAPDKAVVLASRAVKERPDSLTARALLDRARRELLRGRRREKLEERVREARGLFESSQFEAAERIVTSALKLVPNHAVALELFGRMRQRRLQADSAEALAERELDQLARAQARQAFEAARGALAGGWERKAILALRRGLRLIPDDPDLLGLLAQVQGAQADLDRERARRRALLSQVRAGIDLIARGNLTESLKILRAVLREDPDNLRAQAAVQEIRRVWLLRRAVAEARAEPVSAQVPPAEPAPARRPAAARPAASRPPLGPAPVPAPAMEAPPVPRRRPGEGSGGLASGPRPPARPLPLPRTGSASGPRASPASVTLLPRKRRGPTPLVLTIAGAAVFIAVVVFMGRPGRGTSVPATPVQVPVPRTDTSTAPAEGPLSRVDPDLRRAIEGTLAGYSRALETGDERLLAQVRPDLTAVQREQAVARFAGALNAATDLRVLDVVARADEVVVLVMRTDIIVLEGGKGGPSRPVEERLRFQRRGGEWALR